MNDKEYALKCLQLTRDWISDTEYQELGKKIRKSSKLMNSPEIGICECPECGRCFSSAKKYKYGWEWEPCSIRCAKKLEKEYITKFSDSRQRR